MVSTTTASRPVSVPPAPPTRPPAPPAGRRGTLLAASAVGLAVALITTVGVSLFNGDDGGAPTDDAAPPSREVVTSAPTTETETAEPATPEPATPETTTSEPTDERTEDPTDEPTDDPTRPATEEVSLTTLDPVAHDLGAELIAGSGTLNTEYHEVALVPDGYRARCGGFTEYNLGRAWTTLSMVAGVSDSSEEKAVRLTVEVDGTSVYSGEITLGAPRSLDLDVTDGLRLTITWEESSSDDCETGDLVLGTPTLRQVY
ncbi:hypothetical protein EBN88_19650 [Streptomyces triticirhizae]|uniref:Glycosyl hydrolase family 98 putative carbohydrate-binding module domain-containing protein n=1 Tax=Streptomyces triticirhizae TaxID=2483353 RepID=A0A3M2LL06_9ACTN|nr:hypothetical protein EBN88_19650 [Streptomyces triticirhizae]